MTNDTLICGAITYTAILLGLAAGMGWLRANRERRRLRRWGNYWHGNAIEAVTELDRIRIARSTRGKHARGCQVNRDRERVAATAARLRAEANR